MAIITPPGGGHVTSCNVICGQWLREWTIARVMVATATINNRRQIDSPVIKLPYELSSVSPVLSYPRGAYTAPSSRQCRILWNCGSDARNGFIAASNDYADPNCCSANVSQSLFVDLILASVSLFRLTYSFNHHFFLFWFTALPICNSLSLSFAALNLPVSQILPSVALLFPWTAFTDYHPDCFFWVKTGFCF